MFHIISELIRRSIIFQISLIFLLFIAIFLLTYFSFINYLNLKTETSISETVIQFEMVVDEVPPESFGLAAIEAAPFVARIRALNPHFGYTLVRHGVEVMSEGQTPAHAQTALHALRRLATEFGPGGCGSTAFRIVRDAPYFAEEYVLDVCDGNDVALFYTYGIEYPVPPLREPGAFPAHEFFYVLNIRDYGIGAVFVLAYVVVLIWLVGRSITRFSHLTQTFILEAPERPIPEDKAPLEALPLIRTVNRLAEQLRRAFDKQGFFLSSAAHELRTPLAILRTRLDLLPDGPQKDALCEDARRINKTVNDLLEFMRLRDAPETSRLIQVRWVCEAAIQQTSDAASVKRVSLLLDGPQPSPSIHANPDLVVLALVNLINNAISFSPEAGFVTIVYTETGQITVEDEGPGIAPAIIDRIEEPFAKYPSDRRGSGLGLSIVTRVMTLHGGRLDIGEAEAGGARFGLVFGQPKSG